jgi:hypothetical protein
MPLLRAGFFRELEHGNRQGPSIIEATNQIAPPDRNRVVQYLRSGSVLAATACLAAEDWFDSTKTSGSVEVLTDGVWAWPGDLAYYVENYGVGIPAEFLAHMHANKWCRNPLSCQELLEAEANWFQ